MVLTAIAQGIATAAQWLWNGALGVGRTLAATALGLWIATKIAMGAAAIATGIATAAQWALNVALWANPIGLAILAIGLLVIALVAAAYLIWKYRDAIMGFFSGTLDFFKAGVEWMAALAKGILSGLGKVKDAVGAVLGGARNLLPFSDAREGPLSRLTESGRSLPETFAAGIQKSSAAIGDALTSVIPLNGLSALPVGPAPVGVGSGAAGPSTTIFEFRGGINIRSTSPEKIPDDTAEKVRDKLRSVVEEWDSLEAG